MDFEEIVESQQSSGVIATLGLVFALLAIALHPASPSSPALAIGVLGGLCGLVGGLLVFCRATLTLRKHCICCFVVEIAGKVAYFLDMRIQDDRFDIQPAFVRVDHQALFLRLESRDYPAKLNLSWPLEDGRKIVTSIRRTSDDPADVFERMHGQKLDLAKLRQNLLNWNRTYPGCPGVAKDRFRAWTGGAYEMTEFMITGKRSA